MALLFIDGFDKYSHWDELENSGEWTANELEGGGSSQPAIVDGLTEPGRAIQIQGGASGGPLRMWKTLSGTYATIVFGFTINMEINNLSDYAGVQLLDGATEQLGIGFNGNGQLTVRRGSMVSGTLLDTSTETISNGANHTLEVKVTINTTTGSVVANLDGVEITNISGVNTDANASGQLDTFAFSVDSGGSTASTLCKFDNLYILDTTGGSPLNDILGEPIVETTFPNSDVQQQWTIQTTYMGEPWRTADVTPQPGANRLYLRKFTAPVTGNIDSLQCIPAATNGTARFKGAIYADNGSGTAPSGSPLKAGDEITGTTAGANLTLTLPSSLAITSGTIYWIGWITDSSVNMYETDDGLAAFRATATYTSGVPDPAPSMTSGIENLALWANVSGMSDNYTQVDFNPDGIADAVLLEVSQAGESQALGDLSYNDSSTVNNEDLYGHNALVNNPSTIFSAVTKALIRKTDGGARTIDIRMKSGTTSSSGARSGLSPSTSYTYLWSNFDTDPDTGSAWTKAGLDAASRGQKVAS